MVFLETVFVFLRMTFNSWPELMGLTVNPTEFERNFTIWPLGGLIVDRIRLGVSLGNKQPPSISQRHLFPKNAADGTAASKENIGLSSGMDKPATGITRHKVAAKENQEIYYGVA